MPKTGNRTIGIIEVIGKGNASVTQYTDISSTTYIHLNSCKLMYFGWLIRNCVLKTKNEWDKTLLRLVLDLHTKIPFICGNNLLRFDMDNAINCIRIIFIVSNITFVS